MVIRLDNDVSRHLIYNQNLAAFLCTQFDLNSHHLFNSYLNYKYLFLYIDLLIIVIISYYIRLKDFTIVFIIIIIIFILLLLL